MRDGLLLRRVLDKMGEETEMIVLLKSVRKKVLSLVHEKCGLFGSRKVKELVQRHFTWQSIGKYVAEHCKSYSNCRRSVLSEPFEVVAFDLVGLLPKGKGGCRNILTYVCLASRWPDAVALRTVTTTKAVARRTMEIISRTGVPLRILTNRGPHFVGNLGKELSNLLRTDKVQTTAYHTNGALRTCILPYGIDWVD